MRCMRLSLLVFLTLTVSAQTIPSREMFFSAIQQGTAGDVERLIKNGMSPNVTNAEGLPALMAATLFGDAEMMGALLRQGADPNRKGPAGATSLLWAVPDLGKVRLLLARGANPNTTSETGRTPLLVAASFPRTRTLIQALLEAGADLRAQDLAGLNALGLAVRSSDIEVVRFLVERGLDPKALNAAAIRVGLQRNNTAVAEYLMPRLQNPATEVLVTAAVWQPAVWLDRWIELGANVNASLPAVSGKSPLLSAVTSEAGTADTVKLLLARGADPNGRSTDGESPLDWAIYKGDRAKIEVLEQYGARRGDGPRQEVAPLSSGGIADPRTSVSRSLAKLLDVAPAFREKTPAGCVSCHHNAMPALAAGEAKRKGIVIDGAMAQGNIDDMVTFLRANVQRMMLGEAAVGGEAMSVGYIQMALASHGRPPDLLTAAISHWLLARQMPDGNWLGNGVNRPPSEYSSISHTALAIGGLKAYMLSSRKRQIAESLRLAERWLLQVEAKSAEERAMRLMGLVWAGASRDRVSGAMKEVRDRQEAGGGWSQFGRTPADAYATGLSLYALRVGGMRPTDEVYRNGVRFLLGTQYPDGTWLVKTHAFPQQQYFESGFPFGRHQWISAAGTSWAAMAIAQTLPDAQRN